MDVYYVTEGAQTCFEINVLVAPSLEHECTKSTAFPKFIIILIKEILEGVRIFSQETT